MPLLQNGDPTLRVYFQKYSIPDIYEALLGGLLVMCPEDPLRFLEEKIKEIMEKGLYGIIWNMCIDPELSLKLRVLSETYLHTLLGLDDDQLCLDPILRREESGKRTPAEKVGGCKTLLRLQTPKISHEEVARMDEFPEGSAQT
ncbi:hypothetical protein Chor_002513 [Crotalus horridus]